MHPSPVTIGLLIVLGILLMPYVLGPILVLSTLRFRMPPEVIPVDPAREPLPDAVRRYFHQAYGSLIENGFELAGTMYLPAAVPNVRSLLAVYVNRSTGENAMSTFIVAQGGMSPLRTKYVEYVTRFSDGVVVQTNNSRELGSFPPLPGEYTMQFWDIDDAGQLCKLHRFLAQKYRASGQPVSRLDAEFGGNAAAYVARAVLEESLADQVGAGYMVRTPQGFRPSIKGAVIMAWQECWPLKALRRWRRRRRAQELLREFAAFDAGPA